MADEFKRPPSNGGRPNRRSGRRRYFRNNNDEAPTPSDTPPSPKSEARVNEPRTSRRHPNEPRAGERRESERRENEPRTGERRESERRENEPRPSERREGGGSEPVARDDTRRESGRRDRPRRSGSAASRSGSTAQTGQRSAPATGRSGPTGQRSSATGQGGQRNGSNARNNAEAEAQEARRARRRRRRSGGRAPERETPRTENITSASDLGYKPPSSVFIYTHVSHSEAIERYDSRVEHFSSVGRKLEDYEIDLAKITDENGGIRMTKINVDFGDFDFDAPETEEERIASEKAQAEKVQEAAQRNSGSGRQ